MQVNPADLSGSMQWSCWLYTSLTIRSMSEVPWDMAMWIIWTMTHHEVLWLPRP